MFILCACLTLVGLGWFYLRNNYSYWQKRGIPTTDYKYVFGHLGRTLTLAKSPGQIYTEIYEAHEGYNYAGFYKFLQPGLILRSPDIIKDVLIKNFNSFHDNDFDIDEKDDIVFGKSPFVLKGDRWKTVRNQITPCFSVSKLKAMMPLLQLNAKKMMKYMAETPKTGNTMCFEAKELSAKYTAENVASCAFGLEGGCFENEEAEFREYGKRFMNPTGFNILKITIVTVIPSLAKFLKIRFTPEDVRLFLKSMVQQTTDYRKANNIVRNDFIEYMTQLRSKINDEKLFNIDDIVSHAGGFLADGYETSAIISSYIFYELATNSDVQEKLRHEIDEMLKKTNGEFTYDAIQEMNYLDCVVKENLRKNVPLTFFAKLCTEDFQLPPIREDNTGPSLVVQKGTTVIIPVHAVQNDAKYYADPQRFDPERFAEGKSSPKGLYLPFGEGPRMCLGMKFGLLQIKLAVASVVAEYEITVNSKTQEPLKIDSKHFMLLPVGGLWLNFHQRM